MKKPRYVYAETYGSIYRFTFSKWIAMIKRVAAGDVVAFGDYGEFLGNVDFNITKLGSEDAQEILRAWKEE